MTSIIFQRIQNRLDALGMSANEASIKAGLGRTAIQSIRIGKAKSPRADTLKRLADVLECDVAYLTGDIDSPRMVKQGGNTPEIREIPPKDFSSIPLVGIVEAGTFREMDQIHDIAEFPTVAAPRSDSFPSARHVAFEVRGDSMNAAGIHPGDTLLCVDWVDTGLSPVDGMVVVVERTIDDGHLREWTVKEVEVQKDRYILHPRSTNASHKPITIMKRKNADNGVTVNIIALVYGSFRKVGRFG